MTAILLTGVGKRYDIVSAFAQHATVVAADPNPLAPAQYAAHHRVAVPLIKDPAYVPALRALCDEHGVGAIVPLTDLDIETLAAGARRRAPARGARARAGDGVGDLRQVRGAPELLGSSGCRRPPTVLPGTEPDAYPVMIKPRRGSGAESIFLARDADEAAFFVRYSADNDPMIQRRMNGPEFSIDCLSATPRAAA